jgi:hypothetical protein
MQPAQLAPHAGCIRFTQTNCCRAPWGAMHYPPAVGETRSASQNASCAQTACNTNAFLISKDPSALHLHKLLPKETVRAPLTI